MAHSAGLAYADRASRGTASQTARPVSIIDNSRSITFSNPKYRLKGPGECPITILTTSMPSPRVGAIRESLGRPAGCRRDACQGRRN